MSAVQRDTILLCPATAVLSAGEKRVQDLRWPLVRFKLSTSFENRGARSVTTRSLSGNRHRAAFFFTEKTISSTGDVRSRSPVFALSRRLPREGAAPPAG